MSMGMNGTKKKQLSTTYVQYIYRALLRTKVTMLNQNPQKTQNYLAKVERAIQGDCYVLGPVVQTIKECKSRRIKIGNCAKKKQNKIVVKHNLL